MEKYTRNVRFCLICNYVGKIIPALQSRCTRFRFPPLGEGYVRSRLQHVLDAEAYGRSPLPCVHQSCSCSSKRSGSGAFCDSCSPTAGLPGLLQPCMGGVPVGSLGHCSMSNERSFLPGRVNLGPGGMDALVTLGAGDMRRTLNILQV